MDDPQRSGQFISWREYTDRQESIRKDHDATLRGLANRVDMLEAVIDQQRGARALVYALIGSNLLAVVAVLYGIVR